MVNLLKSLSDYFPYTSIDIEWVRNPFIFRKQPAMLEVQDYESPTDLHSSSALKHTFEFMPLNDFWVGIRSEYSKVYLQQISQHKL